MPQLAKCSADKMSAQTGFHADDTRGQFLEITDQRQALNLPAQDNLTISIKTNEVKDFLTDIDADRGE